MHRQVKRSSAVAVGLALLLSLVARAHAFEDVDADGIIDDFDNCVYLANADQMDSDGDNVGNACDNCPDVFNPAQSDGDDNGIGDVCDSTPSTALLLRQVQLRADPRGGTNGKITVKAVLDTTELGGLDGLRAAVRNGLALSVTGGGLQEPETMYFPGCPSMISCSGTGHLPAHPVNREFDYIPPDGHVGFLRIGSTNLFTVRLNVRGRAFGATLAAAPIRVTLSVGVFSYGTAYFGGIDHDDSIDSCQARRNGKSASCRR